MRMSTHLSFLDLFLLLLHELGRDPADVLLRAATELPQLAHEDPGILGVEEAGQVDLDFFGVRILIRYKGKILPLALIQLRNR